MVTLYKAGLSLAGNHDCFEDLCVGPQPQVGRHGRLFRSTFLIKSEEEASSLKKSFTVDFLKLILA